MGDIFKLFHYILIELKLKFYFLLLIAVRLMRKINEKK